MQPDRCGALFPDLAAASFVPLPLTSSSSSYLLRKHACAFRLNIHDLHAMRIVFFWVPLFKTQRPSQVIDMYY